MSEAVKAMKAPQKMRDLEFNKGAINVAIDKQKKYEEKGVLIRAWEGGEDSQAFYLGQIELENTKFLGVLNARFQRENMGLYSYSNGEKYFGWFNENLRDRHGIYFWPPKASAGGKVENEMYFGFWKNNEKYDHGLYLWINEKENNTNFNEADFDVYVGKLDNDTYSRGTYLTKKGDNYYLYYGSFKPNGTRCDPKAFYYSSASDRLIVGSIENNLFKQGHIAFFDDQGDMDTIVYASFNADGSISEIKNKESLDQPKVDTLAKEMSLFRSVILEKDYFGDIYAKYKEINAYVNKSITSLAVFDDKEAFPKLLKLSTSYNELNLSAFIEKKALSMD